MDNVTNRRGARRACLMAVVVLPLAIITGCGGDSEPASDGSTTHFNIGLATTPISMTEVVPTIAVPSQLGFFKDERVSVDVQPMAGSTAVIQAETAGSIEVGEASSTNVIQSAQKGVPVKSFLALGVSYPYKAVTLPGSGIAKISDLKGKTLGVTSLASASFDVAKAEVKAAGLTGKVKIAPIGSGAAAVAALKSGQADALVNYTGDLLFIEQSGVKLDDVDLPRSLDRGHFGVTWTAPESVIKRDSKALTGLSRAMLKGLIWSAAHPEDAVKLGYKEFPQLKPPSNSYDKQFKLDVASMKQTLSLIAPPFADGVPGTSQGEDPSTWKNFGCVADKAWNNMIKFAEAAGNLTDGKPEISDVWDGSICNAAGEGINNQEVIDTRP
ncbi:ABC transporter substrate-binding protein [Streptomyces canus]|uniref:ABC transporter substrate-binding protein n=1 Tax=Streptomyces canus TaxID=58343 RepID=UPI0003A5CA2B|nr:ABC transporter substrate-binding protein [Streptomyces canus]